MDLGGSGAGSVVDEWGGGTMAGSSRRTVFLSDPPAAGTELTPPLRFIFFLFLFGERKPRGAFGVARDGEGGIPPPLTWGVHHAGRARALTKPETPHSDRGARCRWCGAFFNATYCACAA